MPRAKNKRFSTSDQLEEPRRLIRGRKACSKIGIVHIWRGERELENGHLMGYLIKRPSLSGNLEHHKVLWPHELTYFPENCWIYASNIWEHFPSVKTAKGLNFTKTIYQGKSVLTLAEHPVVPRQWPAISSSCRTEAFSSLEKNSVLNE